MCIRDRVMMAGLSIGMSVSLGLSMVRVLTGVSLLWFLVPGYALSLIHIFTKLPVNTQTAAAGAGQPAPKTRTAVFDSCGAKFSCAVPRSELCGTGPGSFCLL